MLAEALVMVCLGIGLGFNGLGMVGLIRFPDVYTRLHATTKATTFGSIFTSLGVIMYGLYSFAIGGEGQYITLVLHTAIAVVALAVTNATGAHAIARAAHRSGIFPTPAVVDRLKEARK